ncbi:MAG: dethiobiotin synthase [Acidobacteriota bacterium]
MSVFVLGTDTEIGKTIGSALLAARYRSEVPELAYWKPVASGSIEGRDVETVATLAGVETIDEAVLLREPLSPHLAARLEGERIDPDRLIEQARDLMAQRPLLIEGIGGIHVPLTDEGDLFTDFAEALGLPAVVVARSTLGTINHTLLTLEVLRSRGIEVLGVLVSGPRNAENVDAIHRFGVVPILGEAVPIDPLDRDGVERLAATLDPEGRLCSHLSVR